MMMDDENGARQLWCAVLLTAVEDANYTGTVKESLDQRRKALAWLTEPNPDFPVVCRLAGLDPLAVRERIRAQLCTAPGVGDDFAVFLGTGGGSTPQDFSQLEFSK